MADKFLLQFREHRYLASSPSLAAIFSKPDANTFKVEMPTASGTGDAHAFACFNRLWLSDKKVSLTWATETTGSTCVYSATILDGLYTRSSMVDFPNADVRLVKGAGILQTINSHTADQASTTHTAAIDVSEGNQEYATIFITTNKPSVSGAVYGYNLITALQILDADDVLLAYADIGGSQVNEQISGLADYGYVGETITWTDNYLIDRGRSRTRMQGVSLGGGWDRHFI